MGSNDQQRDNIYQKFNEIIFSFQCSNRRGNQEDQQNKRELCLLVKNWLVCTPHHLKFYFLVFFEILKVSAEKLKYSSPLNVSKSFMSVAQYARHLMDEPWKKEYQTIKTDGGFFQVHIDSYIVDSIKIFKLMGYKHVHAQPFLVLEGDINQEAVAKVYFCCFVASCEMDIVQDIYDKLAETYGIYSIQDIMKCRMETFANIDQSVKWVTQHSKPTDVHVGSKYRTFGYKSNNEDTKTGLDEKLPSMISKFSTDGVKPTTRQLFTKTLREDLKKDDYRYKDPILEDFVIPDATGNTSEEDLYQPADLDEHVERSLNFLKEENDTIPSIPPDSYPQAGASTEWDFVRKKLTQDYGYAYFEGERGDLTKMATCKNFSPRENGEVHIKSKPVQQITVNLTPPLGEEPLAVDCPASPISAADAAHSVFPKPTDLHKVFTTNQETKAVDTDNFFQHDRGLVSKPLEDRTSSSPSKGYYSTPTKTQSSQTPGELKGGNWHCPACTLSNEATSLVCAACDKSRQVVKTPTLTSGGPECPQCTLVNRRGADKCEACDTPLAGSPTYI